MSRTKILKKTKKKSITRKPQSRRILKKLVQERLNEILSEISLESTSPEKINRSRLINRQLINFLEKDYLKISILDTCSPKNLIDFCDDYYVKKKFDKAKTYLIHHPVLNQDAAHIIDKCVLGWFSSEHSEIVITGDLSETKSTLIHEFSHFLYDYKFGHNEWDFIDSVNDEFESYFQELVIEVGDGLLSNYILQVENIQKIREMFETRFGGTIYELFVFYLENEINDYCQTVNLLRSRICLNKYLNYCFKIESQIPSLKSVCLEAYNYIYNSCFYYVNYYSVAESKKKLDDYFQYCETTLIKKFENPVLKKNMNKCLELVSNFKTKIYAQDINFLKQFIES